MKPPDREKYSWFDKFGIMVAVVVVAVLAFGSVISVIQYSRRATRDFESRQAQHLRELEAERATNVQAVGWYSLSPKQTLVCELTLPSQQTTNIVLQITNKVVLGFKTAVAFSYAAEHSDLLVTLKSLNTFGKVSSGCGAGSIFEGSPEGIDLEVSSDFTFPVRIAIYQEDAK